MFDRSSRLAVLLALGALLAGCPPPSVNPPPREAGDAAPRAALQAFLDAQQSGAWAKAYALLAAPLRARYTPERLQSDYVRDHELADDKLARLRAALAAGAPFQLADRQAKLPLGPDRAATLVEEDGVWRVAALE